jgi:hypothetical protein
LKALEAHPEAETAAMLEKHRQVVQEVQKALRKLARRRRKAALPPEPPRLLEDPPLTVQEVHQIQVEHGVFS